MPVELASDGPPCLYCGGTIYEPLFSGVRDRLGFVAGEWALKRCQACGSAMVLPQVSPSDLPSCYPPVYSFNTRPKQSTVLGHVVSRLEYALFYHLQYELQARKVVEGIDWKGEQGLRLLDIG